MPENDLIISSIEHSDDVPETLEDILQEQIREEEGQAQEREEQEQARAEIPKRKAGSLDGMASMLPAALLGVGWKRFNLGELTDEQRQALDAASLQAILTYQKSFLPAWLADLVEKMMRGIGPWSEVVQLMAVFTMMQVYAKRAENAQDVTPKKKPAPKPAPGPEIPPELADLDGTFEEVSNG